MARKKLLNYTIYADYKRQKNNHIYPGEKTTRLISWQTNTVFLINKNVGFQLFIRVIAYRNNQHLLKFEANFKKILDKNIEAFLIEIILI